MQLVTMVHVQCTCSHSDHITAGLQSTCTYCKVHVGVSSLSLSKNCILWQFIIVKQTFGIKQSDGKNTDSDLKSELLVHNVALMERVFLEKHDYVIIMIYVCEALQ